MCTIIRYVTRRAAAAWRQRAVKSPTLRLSRVTTTSPRLWPDLHLELLRADDDTLNRPIPNPYLTNRTDFEIEFHVPLEAKADGIIIWGSGADVGRRCSNFSKYFKTILGPFLEQTNGV